MKIRFNKKQIPYIVIIVFGALLFTMAVLNHYFFRTVACDYANYNFAFWDYSHFRISPMPSYGSTFLQDHFSLTLMYFVPVYWLLNWLTGTYTLLLIQYSFVLIAAWYTYKLILLKSDNIWLGVGGLIYYFTLLGRYTTFSSDVNLAVISSCFIPIFLYAFEIRKYLIAFVILILSLFSRENIPIWFVFIFIVLIIQHWKDKKAALYSLIGIAISISYFVLLFKVFIPSIETPGHKFTLFNYSALGETPGEALVFILSHPIESVKLFFINHLDDPSLDNVKIEFYLIYLISGGFVLLLRPKYLIWFIPIVAQKVLNDSFIRWGIATYYSIEVVTLLPLAVFLALSSIRIKSLQYSLTFAVCILTIGTTLYKLTPKNCVLPWTMTPAKEQIYNKRFFTPSFNIKKVNELLLLIPPDAKVSASNYIQPHIAQRQYNYFFPIVKDAEYIVFSVFDDNFIYSQFHNDNSRNKYFSDPKWEVIAEEFPVFLFRKKDSEKPINNTLTFIEKQQVVSDTVYCDYELTDEINKHVLFPNGEKADTAIYLSQEVAHSGSNSVRLTTENPTSHIIKIKDIEQISYLQISVWCLCNEEKQANIVARNKAFYISSNEGDIKENSGWEKITLGFWMPVNIDTTDFSIYLWYNGQQPAFFDDLEIIKKFKIR